MKTDYVLRRRALLGISALFCTTLLLFGCQDTAIPVGPELDSPVVAEEAGVSASAKPDCSPWPECRDDGGNGDPEQPTLSLEGGMQPVIEDDMEVSPWPFDVKVKETRKILKASNNTNDNFFKPTIQLNFTDSFIEGEVEGCVGKASFNGQTPAPVRGTPIFTDLLAQLIAKVERTDDNIDPTVVMDVTKDNLGGTGGHSLHVHYEDPNLGRVGIWFGFFGPVIVMQPDPDLDVFEFTGAVNVNSDGGRISCPGQTVVVTLVRNP